MKVLWSSRQTWAGATLGFALAAALVAGFARHEVFELSAEPHERSVRRFAAGAGDVEVNPRRPWARIPRLLPGPDDAWAGGRSHAIGFPLGRRPVRPLVLYVRYAAEPRGGTPARLAVTVNGAVVATLTPEPGRRSRTKIPAATLGDGSDVRLAIRNEAGRAAALEGIRLVEGRPVFAWAHLARRGRFPPESAVLLALSLGSLAAGAAARPASSPLRRALRAAGPTLALALLALSFALPGESLLAARVPRWLWLALPVALLVLELRARARRVPSAHARARVLVRLRGALVNGALTLAGLTVALFAAELALRYVFREVKSAADTRTYFHQQGPSVRLNSFGFLEREFSLRKPANVYRIAVLGDSLTVAGGVPVTDRFTNRLEHMLNASRPRGVRYEVLNFGRTGADTEHEVRTLRQVVLPLQPDFVLLQWYINDFENGVHAGRPGPRPLLPSQTLHLRLLRRSALYSLLQERWVSVQEALGLVETHGGYHERRFGDPEGPDSVYAMKQIHEFVSQAQQNRVPVGIILFPAVDRHLVEGRYPYGFLHERVLEACREREITCVDLRATYAVYRDYKQLWVTPFDGHPSALAHRLAAERLAEALGRTWLEAPLRARRGAKT